VCQRERESESESERERERERERESVIQCVCFGLMLAGEVALKAQGSRLKAA
jgi:hypothetical protein